ncbi:VOC family protein [Chloroflexota bacterium]
MPHYRPVDLERAKSFYTGKLGFTVEREDPGPGAMLESGGGKLYIYERAATKADHTVASFEVADVEGTVKELKAKGMVFEEYDVPGLKTVDSIAIMGTIKGACFKDTEGNILALTSSG